MSTPERLRIEIDPDACVGSGMCAMISPRAFALGDRGISEVLAPELDAEDDLVEAIEGCPVAAIRAFNARTGDQIWP